MSSPNPVSNVVREWAKSKGMKVNDRGRIPRNILLEYQAQTGNEVPREMLEFTPPKTIEEEPFIIPEESEPEWMRVGRERSERAAQNKMGMTEKAIQAYIKANA